MLVEQAGLDPSRFRITSASDNEPMNLSDRSSSVAENSRVEVFLLDETANDLDEAVMTDDTCDHPAKFELHEQP
jgi:hypothetical protein